MFLRYQRRIRANDNTTINLSGSGASITKRYFNNRVSVNSRGHVTLHLARGLSFRVF